MVNYLIIEKLASFLRAIIATLEDVYAGESLHKFIETELGTLAKCLRVLDRRTQLRETSSKFWIPELEATANSVERLVMILQTHPAPTKKISRVRKAFQKPKFSDKSRSDRLRTWDSLMSGLSFVHESLKVLVATVRVADQAPQPSRIERKRRPPLPDLDVREILCRITGSAVTSEDPSYWRRHNRYSDERLAGTCEWVLKDKNYQDWRSGGAHQKCLLCRGASGSGKSVIT
jgi:hypothetical protein